MKKFKKFYNEHRVFSILMAIAIVCLILMATVLIKCFYSGSDKGKYGDNVSYDDVAIEDFIKDHLEVFIRNHFNYELEMYQESDLNNDGVVDEKDKNMLRNYSKLKKGDINSDGVVDVNDLQMVKKYLLGTQELTPGEEVMASTTGGFKPDIRDVVALKQYIVKLIDNFD